MRLEVQHTDHSYERVTGVFNVRKVNREETQCLVFPCKNEIDLRHPIIEHYTKNDNSFDDIINEIANRSITSIIILTTWRVYLNNDMLAKLYNDEFVTISPLVYSMASRPKVVGYVSKYCETVNDCDAMNDGLDVMLRAYSKKHLFKNIRDCRQDSYLVYPCNMRRVDG